MEPTWLSRDLPVLTAVVELYEEHFSTPFGVGPVEVVERTRLTREDVDRAVVSLVDARYLEWEPNRGDDRIISWRITGVSASARRLVGQWPSPEELVGKIVAALNEAAENESDPEKRSKLKEAARSIGSFGKDIVTNVLANLIAGGIA